MLKRLIRGALALSLAAALLMSGGCVSAAIYSFEAEGDLSMEFTSDDEFYFYGDSSLFAEASSSPAKLETPELVLDVALTDTTAILLTANGLYGAGTIADLPFGDASTVSTGGIVRFAYDENAADPDVEVRIVPTDLSQAQQIAAGAKYVLVRMLDGRVYGWGDNAAGQLGSDPETLRFTNVPVRVGELEGISQIAAGRDGLCAALDMDGHVWVWGDCVDAPETSVGGAVMLPIEHAIQVVCGSGAMAVLDADAKVWLWTPDVGVKTGFEDAPAVMSSLPDSYSLVGGDGFFVVADGDGNVRTFGANDEGQLGRDTGGAPDWTPGAVEGLKEVISLSAGRAHVMAMTKNMNIYLWGSNSGGQLGRDGENSTSPLEAPLIRMSLAAGR